MSNLTVPERNDHRRFRRWLRSTCTCTLPRLLQCNTKYICKYRKPQEVSYIYIYIEKEKENSVKLMLEFQSYGEKDEKRHLTSLEKKRKKELGVETMTSRKKRPEHLAPRKKTFRHKRRERVNMTMHPRGTRYPREWINTGKSLQGRQSRCATICRQN